MDFTLLKRQMRLTAVRKRSEIAADYASISAEKLVDLAQRLALPAKAAVSAYWPMKSEMDVRPLMRYFHETGHTVCLPVVTRKDEPMLFRRWAPDDKLVVGMYGVEQPDEKSESVVPDVLFLPLLAFDRRGGRLGYGGGFYDRTLKLLRKEGHRLIAGVGFAMQEVESVPLEETDERLDVILTEKELIKVS